MGVEDVNEYNDLPGGYFPNLMEALWRELLTSEPQTYVTVLFFKCRTSKCNIKSKEARSGCSDIRCT